ncbi:MAG: CPBP family intramembrane glutamic endopeptidase [Thermoanaerobaculia bacterium]|nr:CPBP family intramembrane glutamic endopeptidase [Thermoanaerobaculia bacterium]
MGLTLAVSSVFYVLMARAGGLTAGGAALVPWLMWTPGLVAVALQLRFRRSLAGLGWSAGKTRYWIAGYFVPIAYSLVVYALIWASPLGDFDLTALDRLRERWPLLFLGSLQSCLFALGEEIGWRGYLVPRLARLLDFDGVALTSGLIWALWHAPLVLFAGYRSEAPVGYSLLCFTLLAVGASYLYAWIRLKSGSLWPAVLLHGSHNLWVQGFFDRATLDTGPTEYWSGEFGAGLAAAAIVIALVTRRLARGMDLPRRQPTA